MDMSDYLAINKAIDSLGTEELKPSLKFILREIKLMKDQEATIDVANASKLIDLYDELMGLQDKREAWRPNPTCTNVHIVIGDSFSGSLKQSLKKLGYEDTHKVIVFRENYAIGPIINLDTPEGRVERSQWFLNNITDAFDVYTDFEEEYMKLLEEIKLIPEQAEITVWTSDNACEQIGMRHALYLLRKHTNVISVKDACKYSESLYNEPDSFNLYRYSGEITSKKLQEAVVQLEGKGILSNSDMMKLVQEWKILNSQTGVLRIWIDSKIREVPANYYDQYLLEKLDELRPHAKASEFLISARLIGEAIGYCEQYISASYFEYRLRELIYDGVLEIKGVPAAMRYYSIRRKHQLA